ncbi:LL-diaminopimelate aminotransferase [Afipia felis]|uniref:Aminotransferase n=1 Tax=Afipia felis TaxID=1035 RepID=A0A090MUQ2_AFIFE|nr:aminotransferase class I/II-fold pyridoxal phosphate-dependent enzyme [Afipia felis]CEG10097.1 LL-diaminopimelate aminotransferase [Afipia felis]
MVSSASSRPETAAAPAAGERSPFARLTELLAPYQPGQKLINLSLGEPQHPMPPFLGEVLMQSLADFGHYPASNGIPAFRAAAARWLSRRYRLPRAIDPDSEVLVLNGSREGLFHAAIAAAAYVGKRNGAPAILMPNPFYPAYAAGARGAGCEPIFLPAVRANGFLPDPDALDDKLLSRTVAFYLASPANPQGSVATPAYFARLSELANRHGFMVLSDECYSEIYTRTPPGSILENAGADFKNVVAFQSLSKRSNLPGLRVGFVAGDKAFIRRFHEWRNVAAPQVPVPLQHVGIAAYGDEAHVDENRRLYGLKFDHADAILGTRFGYQRPAGGFCAWLDVSAHGGDEQAAIRLFRDGGVRVLPGSYLARPGADGSNPGAGYIRLALVQAADATKEALTRMVAVLNDHEPRG